MKNSRPQCLTIIRSPDARRSRSEDSHGILSPRFPAAPGRAARSTPAACRYGSRLRPAIQASLRTSPPTDSPLRYYPPRSSPHGASTYTRFGSSARCFGPVWNGSGEAVILAHQRGRSSLSYLAQQRDVASTSPPGYQRNGTYRVLLSPSLESRVVPLGEVAVDAVAQHPHVLLDL